MKTKSQNTTIINAYNSEQKLVLYECNFKQTLSVPQKAFFQNSKKPTNHIQQSINLTKAIDGNGFAPQITPDKQQKPELKKLKIIKNSQKLADLQKDYNTIYSNFLDQIKRLTNSDNNDPYLTQIQCPKIIKNANNYEVTTESKNIIEIIRYLDKERLAKIFKNPLDILSKFRDNQEVALELLKQGFDLKSIYDAFPSLRKNKELVLEAVKENGRALQYAIKKLQENEAFVLEAVKKNGLTLEYASQELQENEDIVLAAVKENGRALQYASQELKENKKVVLEAVKQNGWALIFASGGLEKDQDVVLEAVKENGAALQYASQELKENERVVLEAVKENGLALQYASLELKENKKVVLEAVKQNGQALQYASKKLQENKEFVLEAVKQNGLALQYANKELQKNKEFVLEAIKQNAKAFLYVDNKDLAVDIIQKLALTGNKKCRQLLVEYEFLNTFKELPFKKETLDNLKEKISLEVSEEVYFTEIEIDIISKINLLPESRIRTKIEKQLQIEDEIEEQLEKNMQACQQEGDYMYQGGEFINGKTLEIRDGLATRFTDINQSKEACIAHGAEMVGLTSTSKNSVSTLYKAGEFINGKTLEIRDGLATKFKDINQNLDLDDITNKNSATAKFDFTKEQKREYSINSFLSNEIDLKAGTQLKCISLSDKDQLAIICQDKNITKDDFTVTQDDCGFYYIIAKKQCKLRYVAHNEDVKTASELPEGKVKKLYKEYMDEEKGFQWSISQDSDKQNITEYQENHHKNWLNTIYDSRIGVCRHRVMAFFYKAVEKDINPEDLRIIGIDGNHVIIEAQVNGNWYQIDLGGGSRAKIKNKEQLQPVLIVANASNIEDGKADSNLMEKGATLDVKEDLIITTNNKEVILKQSQNSFNEKFANALKANKNDNILVANASNIDDGKVGSAFNVAVAMLSQDQNYKHNLFIVNSPADLDLTRDQLVINKDSTVEILPNDKPEIYRGGRLLDFVNSSDKNKAIIVNWQNFSEQQKIAYNSLLDRVQMIDGKEINPVIKVISVENSGNSDLSFRSRHQEIISFYPNDSKDFVDKNYQQINNDNAPSENLLVIDIAGLNDYKPVLFGQLKIDSQQQLKYDKSPFVNFLLDDNNLARKVVIKNLKDDKKQELEQLIALAKSCGYFNYFGKRITCPKTLAIEFDNKNFDFTAIKNSITKLSENQSFSQKLHANYRLINPHVFEELVVNSKIEKGKYIEEEGLIKQCREKTLQLYIANNLEKNQYYYLFSQAQEHDVSLDLALARNVKLPQEILDNFKQGTEEDCNEEDFNFDIDDSNDHIPSKNLYGYLEEKIPFRETCKKSKIYLSENQIQSQKIADKLKKSNSELRVIDAEDLIWQKDFFDKTFNKKRDDGDKLMFCDFEIKEGEIITELRKEKNIVLKGEFSEDFLSILQPIILKAGDYKKFGNLSLIVENQDKTLVKQCFSCLSENNIIDSALENQQTKTEIKEKRKKTESFDQEILAKDFIEKRLNLLTESLESEPIVRLTGHSGVGKTSLVKTLAKDRTEKFNLYCEMSELKDWARDTTENKTKILFIDEANIDNLHHTVFNKLKKINKETETWQKTIEIYHQGKFYQLTKDHKVVFAGNPNSYGGGRAEQRLFAGNSVQEIELTNFPKSYICEKLLKTEIFDKMKNQHINEEYFDIICKNEIKEYHKQKEENSNIKNQDTVRELQEKVMLKMRESLITEDKRKINGKNYITTKATEDTERRLNDFIDIRKENQQNNITAGLNGFLIYGPSGIGKSEMARAILESNGYELNQKKEAQSQSNSKNKQYCYIQSSLSLTHKTELIIWAFENNCPIVIDEINCCADDGLEKVLNSALTGYHPENGKKKENNGFFMIATANKVSAQTQGGRKNISPAIIHRCNTANLKPLTEYETEDIKKILRHQQEQNSISKDIAITDDLVLNIKEQFKESKINLRNLSDWVNKDCKNKALLKEETKTNHKEKNEITTTKLHDSIKNKTKQHNGDIIEIEPEEERQSNNTTTLYNVGILLDQSTQSKTRSGGNAEKVRPKNNIQQTGYFSVFTKFCKGVRN